MIIIKRKSSAPGLYQGSPGSSTRVSVSGLYAETGLDGKSVTLHWSAPSVFFDASRSIYQVYKAGSFIATVPATQFTFVDTNVAPGIEYVYAVFLIYNPL